MTERDYDNLDVVIVGGGLFGSIIGRYLEKQGRHVTIFDDGKERAGSKPAACLMKPSWLSKMSKVQQAQSMSVLDGCYGVHEIEAYAGLRTTVFWVPPAAIFRPSQPDRVVKQRVTGVHGDHNSAPWFSVAKKGSDHHESHRAKLIVVATGVWGLRGVEVPGLTTQAGVAFTWPCDPDRESRVTIKLWAPYKQIVALPNRYPGEMWCSDGTAVQPVSLDQKRITDARRRCQNLVGIHEDPTEIVGYRPYIRGLSAPCYLEQPLPNIWVANAGAKNGTAAAGWAAYKIAEATN